MSFDILAYSVRTMGGGQIRVETTAVNATILDANTITFDGGATVLTYTYLGQGNYRGTGTSAEFIQVGGQILAYNTNNPTGALPVGNWQITVSDLDPSAPPCFVAGTQILTPEGEVAVEDLSAGDLVVTVSGKYRPIVWTGARCVAVSALERDINLRPLRIEAGAIGNTRALEVSQQHRILIDSVRAELFFGEPEVLVPAKALLSLDRVHLIQPRQEVHYHHLLLDEHDVIFANGVAAETLFLGEQNLRNVPSEIETLFPGLLVRRGAERTARTVTTVKEGRALFY